ncbi:hypothetical protein GQ457_14G010690 [Hibiscus cannabinus]
MYSIRNVSQEVRFNQLATALVVMNVTATRAANARSGSKKIATEEAQFSSSPTVYTLVQCTPDLSSSDCSSCLQGAVANLSDCCNGRQGGRVLKPSCTVRYDVDPFYGPTAVLTPPPSTQEQETQNNSNSITILVASLSAIFGLAVVSVSGFFVWRRRNNEEHREHSRGQLLDMAEGRILNVHSTETFSGENVGNSHEFPSIQLDTLHAATNHFSHENKLGEGGFGPVYKGTLADGKEIAVKRLSRTSVQGLVELKNEVMLIARLQHRNLVRLLGCCLEKNEKLLVYEFMPNRSLDVFLFDSNFAAQLDWQKRFNIIKGIARGMMYLHEDSRLRIIHRDLKASNVLFDHKMNPKISDFGMARIFGEDRNEANTNRVVGTYGYMAPEYAMEGLFSIKSDVFSFGVLLLEIISGKKNNGFYLSESGESLLTFAWKLWSKGEGMKVVDQLLVPSCAVSEVVKCIHIGLLCVQADPADRPTMSSVVVMLASDAMMLPRPGEPASYVGRGVADPTESSSNDGIGYMAPEYAMRGLFSIKSDVFSFGVLLLEIVSGRKNNSSHFAENGESLLTFAWKLWSEGEGMDLIDQLLVGSCVVSEVLKCIHIGLLCVQGYPADRPTMSSVVIMLASDTISLPRPAEPTFPARRSEHASNDGGFSINEVTISNLLPR